jgi:ABC-type phosphate/phosphonate transport system substrate-binding protein
MIASLQMYDWPEIRDATDAFWHGLSRHMGEAVELTRGPDHKAPWRDPALLFSQTCGYPFTHEFAGKLTLLGTPHYEAAGCESFTYCSFIFARNDAPQIAVINDDDSMSGMLALKLACKGSFAQTHISGGHLASLEALQKGTADICAIDAVCVALARIHRPHLLEGLIEVTRSPSVPGLPFVTSLANASRAPHMRKAIQAAFADPALAQARAALLLKDFSLTTVNDYKRITDLEQDLS